VSQAADKHIHNPILETERLLLRKLRISDDRDIFEYAKNPEISRYVTWETHKSIEDARAFITWNLERYDKGEIGEWGIELKETGRIIGSIGFVELDTVNFCGTVGYALSKKYWGKGIMTEAVKRIIGFAFEEMGLNRVEAVHIPENEASGRVMQKAGMLYEGLLRQRMFAKGRFWDLKQYAIVKDDLR